MTDEILNDSEEIEDKVAMREKKKICGNCFLRSKVLNLCLLSGDHKNEGDSCSEWLTEDTCGECMIDFKKGGNYEK